MVDFNTNFTTKVNILLTKIDAKRCDVKFPCGFLARSSQV